MKNIVVMSRSEARRFSFNKNIPPCIIISINTDGVHNNFSRNQNIKAIKHFTFDDVEDGSGAITQGIANGIADFVRGWIDRVDTVVVHCDAGVSRSAGVGAAIMKWANNDDSPIFDDGRFCPNMRCFRYMLNALMCDVPEKEIYNSENKNIEAWKLLQGID